jgi:hypothetical protein
MIHLILETIQVTVSLGTALSQFFGLRRRGIDRGWDGQRQALRVAVQVFNQLTAIKLTTAKAERLVLRNGQPEEGPIEVVHGVLLGRPSVMSRAVSRSGLGHPGFGQA